MHKFRILRFEVYFFLIITIFLLPHILQAIILSNLRIIKGKSIIIIYIHVFILIEPDYLSTKIVLIKTWLITAHLQLYLLCLILSILMKVLRLWYNNSGRILPKFNRLIIIIQFIDTLISAICNP